MEAKGQIKIAADSKLKKMKTNWEDEAEWRKRAEA